MTTIVTRAGKGSPLTHTEVDTNFTNLNTNKFETAAIPLGTLAAPSISFVGRPNTGIYSPGADTLAFVTAGSNRVHITSGGLVGIGNSSPSSYNASSDDLVVGDHVGAHGVTICSQNNSSGYIMFADGTTGAQAYAGQITYDHTNNRLTLGTNDGTTGLTVDSSQRVGIGTTSPSATLQVDASGGGTIRVLRSSVSANYVQLEHDGTNGTIQSNGSTANLIFNVNSGERARIDSSGRLLVGTSTARDKIYNGTTSVNIPQFQSEKAGDGLVNRLLVTGNNGTTPANSASELILARSYGTTLNSYTAVTSADSHLGAISFQGADGTEFVEAASIQCFTDDVCGANDMPGRLVFFVTADGASSPSEAVRISNSRNTSFTGAILPSSDNTYQCGASGQRWSLIYAANGTIQTSDARDKTDIASAALGIDFIKKLNPVSYKFVVGNNKESGFDEEGNRIYEAVPGKRTHWGFIAQEVKEAADEFGVDFGGWILTDTEDLDSQQGLRYDQFIAPLTKALQEALAEIDILKAKVASLEAQ